MPDISDGLIDNHVAPGDRAMMIDDKIIAIDAARMRMRCSEIRPVDEIGKEAVVRQSVFDNGQSIEYIGGEFFVRGSTSAFIALGRRAIEVEVEVNLSLQGVGHYVGDSVDVGVGDGDGEMGAEAVRQRQIDVS